jgi:hypothetical protein
MTVKEKIEVTVTITSFKQSGKYYTSDEITCSARNVSDDPNVQCLYMSDIVDTVKDLILTGNLPSEFIYHVTHDDGYPCLIFPE